MGADLRHAPLLTLRAEPALGPIGAAFRRLLRPQVTRDNRRTLARLAELAQSR